MLISRDFFVVVVASYNVAVVVVFAWLATSYSSASVMHDLSAENNKDVSIHSYAWKVATVCF